MRRTHTFSSVRNIRKRISREGVRMRASERNERYGYVAFSDGLESGGEGEGERGKARGGENEGKFDLMG
eukprot:720666-Amorphochlora_amoeboformis.AAC.1